MPVDRVLVRERRSKCRATESAAADAVADLRQLLVSVVRRLKPAERDHRLGDAVADVRWTAGRLAEVERLVAFVRPALSKAVRTAKAAAAAAEVRVAMDGP